MREYINSIPELSYTTGNLAELYAAFRFLFPTISPVISNAVGKEILLEPGYRGGTAPEIQQKIITSYVENLVNSKLDGYNTEPFKINVLSQERIFIEKIFAIKEIYEKDNGELLSKKT